MPKIAIVKYLLSNKGGIERRYHNYIDEFLRRGYDITVIFSSEESSYSRNPQIRYKRLIIGIMPTRVWRKILFSRKVTKLLMSNHQFDFSLSMGRTGKANITIAAGNYSSTSKESVEVSSVFRNKLLYLDKTSFQNSNIIVAASEMVKNDLIRLFNVPERKVLTLYPPTNGNEFFQYTEAHKKSMYSKYGLMEENLNFLFVSTGHSRKGLKLLLEVFRQLDNSFQLYVIGDPCYINHSGNIHYLDYSEKPVELYNAVDYLMHPASYEAFGQVVSESLFCGTPVIISDKVGAKEVVNKEHGIVMGSLDPDKWVEMIKAISKPGTVKLEESIKHRLEIKTHMDKMLSYWDKNKLESE